jgi:formylglycine-generating enzyme required for sulfatase activity
MKSILYTLLAVSLTALCWAQAPAKPKADHKDYVEKIPGSDASFEMVAIPAGEFLMGSPDSEKGRKKNEGPQHKVKVHAFWMGKCEVTWDEYRAFQRTLLDMEDNPNKKPEVDGVTFPTKPYVPEDYGHGYGQKPAICMTHHNAMEYCVWLSKKTGKTYRLPTEAEWEYACRAGTTTAYFFGDDPAKLEEYAWTKKNSADADHEDGTTHKVAMKKANPWGLHDMVGNVMEWTLDQYAKTGYADDAKNSLSLNPLRLPTADKWAHVARGGSWKDEEPAAFRSAVRVRSHPDWMRHDPQDPRSIWWLTRYDKIGFRVVRAVEELPALKNFRSKVTKDSKDDLDDEDDE